MASTSSTLHWLGATRALAVLSSLCGATSPMTLLSGQRLAHFQLTVSWKALFAAAVVAAAAVGLVKLQQCSMVAQSYFPTLWYSYNAVVLYTG